MFKDSRPIHSNAQTASTPEMWAATFAQSRRMNAWRSFRFSRTREWGLIRRYVQRGGAVLDAGCGFGEWVSFLNNRNYNAEGIDYSDELIRRLRSTYPHLRWNAGDIRRMPYSDGTFDAVISWGVIEHDEAGPGEALREFHRVLKREGVTIVTVPLDSPAQRRSSSYLFNDGKSRHTFFQYFMTAEELSTHVRSAGFDVLEAGVLPNAVIQLVSPALAARLRGLPLRIANFLVSTFMSWIDRYCVMRYCVARKRREERT